MAVKKYEPDRQKQLTNTVNSGVKISTDVTPNASAKNSTLSSLMANKIDNQKTQYLPTENATQNAYLKMAYDDASKNVDASKLRYSGVTSGGSSYIGTPKVTAADLKNLYGDYGNGGAGGDLGSGGIYARANFQASQAYNDAMAYTSELLSKLSSGRTQYTDQINQLMDTINNRAAFSYDPDNDPLFQQYLASSMESGKTAMADTMAQASALTGGYGSTYATAAANGAYNNYVQDAYNNLPEYYETALNAYNSETQDLYNKLGMYNTADQTEYNRLADAYGNNLAWANDMYGKEYNNYWDSLNFNTSVDQYNADLAYKYKALAQDKETATAKAAASAASEAEKKAEASKPTQSMLEKALKIYNTDELDGGGLVGVDTYVASLPDDIDVEAIADYVLEYGRKRTEADKYRIKQGVANS